MPSLITIIEESLKLLGQHNVECVIIGGVAATLHGATILTNDLDVCYARSAGNLEKLATMLQSVDARLRNAPPEIPFLLDADTLRRGLNFTFSTDVGSLDLFGEVRGVGLYEDVVSGAIKYELFGYSFPVIDIEKLILAKRTAGRPKDMITLPELEAIREGQSRDRSEQHKDR
jgi:predicted nucleotidyltransferase